MKYQPMSYYVNPKRMTGESQSVYRARRSMGNYLSRQIHLTREWLLGLMQTRA